MEFPPDASQNIWHNPRTPPNVRDMPKEKLPNLSICKWNRDQLKQALPILLEQASDARFICKKCGRVAAEKRLLCKAISGSKLSSAKKES
ncbi:MAG: hypothetical protein AAFN70_14985 [Planctomycetota bacterium]